MSNSATSVQHYWRGRRRDLRHGSIDLLAGPGPDTVHDLRAAGRRLKTTSRAFQPLLRGSLRASFLTELDHLNHALGEVRDVEVVHDLVADVGGDTTELAAQRDTLRTGAARLLITGRMADLLDLIDELVERPWRGRYRHNGPPDATVAARVDWAQHRVGRAWLALQSMKDAGDDSVREQEHLLRRRAKAARFTLESVGRSDDAERYARVSDLLGLVQDSLVVQSALSDRTDKASAAAVDVARDRAAEARRSVPDALRAAVPAEWSPV